MSWTDNEFILNQRPTMASRDLFQAVCDEIGKHYSNLGFKYARSRPKITINKGDIKLVVSFNSSRSNTSGDWIALEILPAFYSKQLAKINNSKGILFGHTGLFYHKYTDDPKKIRVQKIFGEIIERIDEYSTESEMIDSNTCNIYGINKEKFDKIIEFIDSKILVWLDKLITKDGIIELTENPSGTKVASLNGKSTNSEFVQYCNYFFPEIDIEKRLER